MEGERKVYAEKISGLHTQLQEAKAEQKRAETNLQNQVRLGSLDYPKCTQGKLMIMLIRIVVMCTESRSALNNMLFQRLQGNVLTGYQVTYLSVFASQGSLMERVQSN